MFFKNLKIIDLIDPFRIVNEWIAIMLELSVNHIISSDFQTVDGIRRMPLPQNGLHPRLDVRLVHTHVVTAVPLVEVGRGQVEI